MRIEAEKLYYGNHKFVFEFDTGAETGANQLTAWFAEKITIDSVPLSHFKSDQLLRALLEPHSSRLRAQLEHEQHACRRPFEQEIADLQRPFGVTNEKAENKQPAKIKRRANDLRKQMNIALQRLNADFMHRVLLPLERQYFDLAILQREIQLFGEEHFLRDFYFEETNINYIRNFCRKFAANEAYRQKALSRETAWAKRNALFLRNLLNVFEERSCPTHTSHHDECNAHDFFHWISKNYEAILALPEYQQIQHRDTICKTDAQELDPLIQPAIELLNEIPGVTTRSSCQGISGKVCFQGHELLVVSAHEEHAYVVFSVLEQSIKDAIAALLPEFSGITNVPSPGNFVLWPVLRSTGDNVRFRTELVALAKRVPDKLIDRETS